jgi:hypothetical protein
MKTVQVLLNQQNGDGKWDRIRSDIECLCPFQAHEHICTAVAEIIENGHVITRLDERNTGVVSDVTRTPSYQNRFDHFSRSISTNDSCRNPKK